MHLELFLALLLTANAGILPAIAPRAPVTGCDPEVESIPIVEFNDGPTGSGVAGIGAEFEAPLLQFYRQGCSLGDTFQAKRKTVAGHSGTNFLLSVDTSSELGRGKLSAEYVLDGRQIKVGDGSAAAAGRAVYDDFIAWEPWTESPPNLAMIMDYPQCPGPWAVLGLVKETDKTVAPWWLPQATASMPLEAIYSLLKENLLDPQGDDRNVLNGNVMGIGTRKEDLKLITKDSFAGLRARMDIQNINDAVLGFCSLIMSYAKFVPKQHTGGNEASPKTSLIVMPRTEFTTVFKQVKSDFPATGELYDIFNVLACYETIKEGEGRTAKLQVRLDDKYCSGTLDDPVPNGDFGRLQYNYQGNFPVDGAPQSFTIEDWINGIDHGNTQPDLLTAFDVNYDASIGGLGTAVERMYGSSRRAVPLFEFRDLDPLFAPGFEDFMRKVDLAVQKLHKNFLNPPTRRVKRQAGASSCILPSPTAGIWNTTSISSSSMSTSAWNTTSSSVSSMNTRVWNTTSSSASSMITAPPSIKCLMIGPSPGTGVSEGYCDCVVGGSSSLTFPLRKADGTYSDSCAYTTVPSATTVVSTDTSSWTSGCQACTLVGGVGGGHESCTTVSGCTPTTSAVTSPTIVAWVANVGTIDIGNAEDDGDGGKSLATKMFNKLSGMCNDTGCRGDHQEMDNVEAAIADEEEPLKPAMYIDGAVYQNMDTFKQMLAVGISSWISALQNPSLQLCTEVDYEADAESTGSGCGSGPIRTDRLRRKVRRDNGTVLWERHGLSDEDRTLRRRCRDNCGPPTVCHYKAVMCQAPDSITVVSGSKDDPYANHLNIAVTLDKTDDGFDCEGIAAGLTAAMALLAPELLEEDALEGVELEALCGVLEDPTTALSSLIPGSGSKSIVRRARRQTVTTSTA